MDLASITVSKETICLPSEAATRAFVQLKPARNPGVHQTKACKKLNIKQKC